jgi:integrase
MAKARSIGQITSKGNNKWLVRIYLGEDSSGKRRYSSKMIVGKIGDAKKALTALSREKDLGVFIEPSNQTINEFFNKWLATSAKQRVSEATFVSYESTLRTHIRPRIGTKKVSQIRLMDMQKIYGELLESGLSARTVRYAHAISSMAFKQAVKWGILARNPCEYADLPKQQRKETKAFSPEQANRFLEVARKTKHGIIFEFALMSGMRPEEYLALKWTDIDFERSSATIRRALVWNAKGGGFKLLEPKTKQSRRTVMLPVSLMNMLKKYKLRQSEYRISLGAAYENFDLVFASEVGGPIHYRNLTQRYYEKILKEAGLEKEGFVLYSLRHSCATLLLIANTNPKVVSERLGHTSVKMTLDTYTHVLPSMQRDATDRLESLLYRRP